MRLRSALPFLVAVLGCAPDAHVSGMEIRDPLGLIDDVYMSGNQLRLLVLPAADFPCDPTTGVVGGWGTAQDDTPVGMAGALVDLSLASGEITDNMVTVTAGEWTVLVRGRGDAMGLMDVIIATGCSPATVEAGGTVEVTVLLAPVTVSGTCGDGTLSQDEQCEGGVACTACRTTEEQLNTTGTGNNHRPRLVCRAGQRCAAVWDDTAGRGPALRLFDPDGRVLTIPTLAAEALTDTEDPLPGTQEGGVVAMDASGRIAIGLFDVTTNMGDARISFWSSSSRQVMDPSANARTDTAGRQAAPAVAVSGGGATMIVFEDARSATGLSGRVVPAGSIAPAGAEAFEVGAGQTGATTPQIAGTPSGFVVVFAAAGDVFYQRFGEGGMAVDTTAQRATDMGTGRDAPSVGATADGSFLVAWGEASADGAGAGVRGRVFTTAGTPVAPAFVLNTTTGGDQGRPSVGASASAFVVAFESAGSIRARAFTSTGDPQLNRERPPSFADFEVAPAGIAPWAATVGSGATQAWWIAYENANSVFARRFPL